LKHKEIENIIFDLGGVIINLDIDQTFRKFSELFQKDVNIDLFSKTDNHQFFWDYEIGKIDDSEFRQNLRQLAGIEVEDRLLDEAWIAMLQDIPTERIEWIYEATKNYNCVVLSNTNHIHVKYFEKYFNSITPYGYLKDFFQKLYYSFEIGERKPDPESFEFVLKDSDFDPVKTLLLDDLKDNLDSANRLGIQTVYVERNHLRKEQLPNGRK